MKCLREYGECDWTGEADECMKLNGNPICPKCGSSIGEESRVHPYINDILNQFKERMAV